MADRKSALERPTLGGASTSTGPADGKTTLALTILAHPDLGAVGDRALLPDLIPGEAALVSRAEPAFAPPGQAQGEPLGDEHLSRKPIRLVTSGDGDVRLELDDSSTAVVVRGKRVQGSARFSAAQVQRGVVIELGHRVVLLLHTATPIREARGGVSAPREPRELAGESDGLRQVLWEILSVADLDLPVLLRGETGCGKELVASAIHRAGPRRDRPLLTVNLGAISPSLAIAELFGAERGAHSTAVRRQLGYFEQAHDGTLFLDEIGEAPPELQVALLRVLETGEMQAVGGQIRKVNVRIIAATDADLEAKVAAGTFRAPLLNRLSTYEVWIPPLRARRDDIGRLLARFLREELDHAGEAERLLPPAPGCKPWLPAALVARLAEHDWPGNVRQLRNVVRQLVVGSRGRDRLEITPAVERLLSSEPERHDAARRSKGARSREATRALPTPRAARRQPAEATEDEIGTALRESRWDLAAAARQLGISRASMYLLIERYPRFHTARDLTPEQITRCHRECDGDLGRMVERLEVSERALVRRVRELGLA